MLENAVKKAIAEEWKNIKLEEGVNTFRGQVVIDVDIVVVKSRDTTAKPTANILNKKFLAFILNRAGFQKDKIAELITGAMQDSLDSNVKVDEVLGVTEEAMKFLEEEVVNKLPRVPKSGPTSIKGIVRLNRIEEMK